MRVRVEEPRDRAAVRAVNVAAFPTPAEADLVDALRAAVRPLISLVAELDHGVIGHILFSPVSLSNHPGLSLLGLAPMAVAPERQRTGVGSALVRAGLERCAHAGCDAVVVVGHPTFYPRFGFIPGSRFTLRSEYDVPDDVFMVCELQRGALRDVSGVVRYDAVFGGL
jgi:putative acetyltransferase